MPVVLFPHLPNSAHDIVEGVGYQTDVLQAYGGSEQRISLRSHPDLSLRLEVDTWETGDAQLLRALLSADPETGYLVPWWPYARRLDSAAAGGATSLQADLSGVPDALQDGVRRFLLWRSARDTELVVVSARSGSTLTLSATLDGPWTAGATLVPLLQTYLDGQSGSRRVGAAYGGGSWSFRADLTQCALPAGTEIYDPGAYLGLDVMTGFWGADSGPEPWTRRAAVVEADAGRRVYDSQDAAGGLTRTLAMPGRTSAEALAVRRFLAARLGRLRPFWLPTYDHDLTLAGAAGSGASSIDVYDTGYSDLLWPSRARRHLAIRCPSGATVYREIAEPEDQGAGVSRLNFVSGTLPEALPAGTGVSFLRHCRLADDLTEFAWSHVEYCDVTLRAQELPVDCPAGVTS